MWGIGGGINMRSRGISETCSFLSCRVVKAGDVRSEPASLALGGASCQCAAWGSEAGGRAGGRTFWCKHSEKEHQVGGPRDQETQWYTFVGRTQFLVFYPVRSIWGSLHGPKTNTALSLPHPFPSHVFTMWSVLSSGTAVLCYWLRQEILANFISLFSRVFTASGTNLI
jgi:hypothetical protein